MLGIIAFILTAINIVRIILIDKELNEYEKRMDKTFEEFKQMLDELEKRGKV